MNLNLKKLKEAVSAWQNISVHPHRFGGMEFQFGDAEVGHVHTDGSLIYPSRVQSAMHCWQMVLLRSITGFQTQAGSPFRYAVKKTSAMHSGSFGFHISATR